MRLFFIAALIALLLGAASIVLIEKDPGYVLVAYGNWTLETSVWIALVGLFVAAVLCYITFWILRRLLRGPGAVTGWLGNRASRQSARLTTRGLINFIEGNWSRSRRQLLRGARNNDAPLLNYLIAARASYQLGETDQARRFLGQAQQSESEAGIAVELTQAELHLTAGRYEQAIATLVRARRNSGKHPYVLQLLQQAYRQLGDWDSLAALLPELKKHDLLDDAGSLEVQRNLYLQQLQQGQREEGGDAVANLHREWQQVPSVLKKDENLVVAYVRMLLEAGAMSEAEKVIARFQKQQWSSDLVRLYGLLDGGDTAKQLAQAERWLPAHEEDPELLLALGRLSARDELWGKARDYFERSYRLEHTTEVCAELGRLLAHLGENAASAAYLREGLLMSLPEFPALPMPEVPPRLRQGETTDQAPVAGN